MKFLVLLFAFSLSTSILAQESNPKKVVDDFFVAFHAKDTLTLKQLCHPEIVMRTIANTKEGNKLKDEKFDEFLNSIATIPANMKIFEKLTDYQVSRSITIPILSSDKKNIIGVLQALNTESKIVAGDVFAGLVVVDEMSAELEKMIDCFASQITRQLYSFR